MRLNHSFALALAAAFGLAACQPSPPADSNASTAEAVPAAVEATQSEPAAPPTVEPADESRQRLEAVAAGDHRAEADRARDAHRHPVETLLFFDLQPDATVLELTPGGGWYTDILAPYLRAHGRFIAAIWDESFPDQPAYYARLNQQLTDKITAAPGTYGEPELRRFNAAEPSFGEPDSVDVALTFRNAHNWYQAGTQQAYIQALYDVLKPGGTLGLVDHRSTGSEPLDGNTGYLTEEQVIELAASVGFELAGRCDINANPNDGTDHPRGVWTLPPGYAMGDEDREKYAAIGESNRMTLKFVKPDAAR